MTKISIDIRPADLRKHPIWKESELGLLVPPAPYALSFALPQWGHVVGYIEHEMHILERTHQTSTVPYMHPQVRKLFKEANISNAVMGEEALAFPSKKSAMACQAFVERAMEKHNLPRYPTSIQSYLGSEVHALTIPASVHNYAWQYYTRFSEQVSARRAASLFQRRGAVCSMEEKAAVHGALRSHLAKLAGCGEEGIYFHTNFGAALGAVHRAMLGRTPELKSLHIGYPFIDFYEVCNENEPGAHFYSWLGEEEFASLESLLEHEKLAYVLCEAPCIPLMNTLDLPALSDLLRDKHVPLVVDDSASTFYNVDVAPYADIILSSLGGFFCGQGDSHAACLRLSPDSPLFQELRQCLDGDYEALLSPEDAEALIYSSADFAARMEQVNESARDIADWMHGHHGISRVYYPKMEAAHNYEAIKRPGRGYGGLLHFMLRRESECTPPFYNAVEMTKALTLGTPFSVISPYTMLKFPSRLDWAEIHGVPRHLLRLSVGLEPVEEIKRRIAAALSGF